ncbi:NADH dehydrogenase [ubiquinone] 1 alpha subcomplex subunit 4-like 2 [Alligator mississippiensis]|uniref:NADH dehydrogenase [ubiquinone] 1 alpha subcomplex subunit 4-like 2 n=1 Tax=Alligator mississippiensis TaxID=8496 RepID=A0A151PJU9_ALLMI|nr:NADH dehydrogenase [ubiquinone] 1 alpha subcomplex subunit 4-like 2 [Alligator mississippiensis]
MNYKCRWLPCTLVPPPLHSLAPQAGNRAQPGLAWPGLAWFGLGRGLAACSLGVGSSTPGESPLTTQLHSSPRASHRTQLIPLISFISLGMGSAVLYLLRLALYSPDVSWDRKNNPEPWNKLGPTDQYKFFAVSTDYKSLKKDRPDF